MDARERATNWLIEHNHHGCHIDVHPDADMPLPADVDSLAALLAEGEKARADADRFHKVLLSLSGALDVPRELVPADITTLIEQRDVAQIENERLRNELAARRTE
jgi:hypothetical protein